MASISFYARVDSETAKNGTINVQPTSTYPTTELTFTSGDGGDLALDFNDGGIDPDTQVIIDGVTYDFTVVMQGYLPTSGPGANGLDDVNGEDLRGERVIVIEVAGVRYFFLPDAGLTLDTMDAFPQGGQPLDSVTTVGPLIICFVAGTMILTPEGERPVEDLSAGDLVLNARGEPVRLLWNGRRRVMPDEFGRHPQLRPVRIPQDHFGPGKPGRPLLVSPQHRVWIEGWAVELLIGAEAALVPAIHLVDGDVRQVGGDEAVVYHHLLFEEHEIVVSNGLPTESLQPTLDNVQGSDPAARAELDLIFPEGIPYDLATRSAAAPSLKSHESRLVARPTLWRKQKSAHGANRERTSSTMGRQV
ncbi:Hint domain-containing protein [Ostreiculturibacter nitratireducens]|uniref:Hint domain-containing protein n=1 Tax=Ostreiculturibacter nitratireducens TaxID=3075226 RepID=UPI0031B58990